MQYSLSIAAAGLAFSAGAANAASISPGFDVFDDVNAHFMNSVSYGGTGIPTGPAAISEIAISGSSSVVRVSIAATKRYASPALTDDAAGTYFATPGLAIGAPVTAPIGGRWNFSFAAEIIGTDGLTFADTGLELLYDLDPGAATDEANLGVIDLTALGGGLTFLQGSENLNFGYLAVSNPTFGITAPSFTPFDMNAGGEYSFLIRADAAEASINVNVVSPIPLPAGLPLLAVGLGLLGIGAWRRTKSV